MNVPIAVAGLCLFLAAAVEFDKAAYILGLAYFTIGIANLLLAFVGVE